MFGYNYNTLTKEERDIYRISQEMYQLFWKVEDIINNFNEEEPEYSEHLIDFTRKQFSWFKKAIYHTLKEDI